MNSQTKKLSYCIASDKFSGHRGLYSWQYYSKYHHYFHLLIEKYLIIKKSRWSNFYYNGPIYETYNQYLLEDAEINPNFSKTRNKIIFLMHSILGLKIWICKEIYQIFVKSKRLLRSFSIVLLQANFI